jgi:epoxyqueuosine reductase
MIPADENNSKIETLCRQWGGALFGVADLRPFKKEELLLSPELIDRHPFAISVGYHLSDAILDEIVDRPTPLYFQHYQRTNILLDTIGLILNHAIQALGCQAIPIPASQLVDWEKQRGHLSHKHVAQAAGMGWIGRNNLLVNERFGARIRLLTVLTNLPLQVYSRSAGDCGSCHACVAVCPAGAIRERPEDFDHLRCYEQLKVFSKTLRFSHNICGVCIRACRGKKKTGVEGSRIQGSK